MQNFVYDNKTKIIFGKSTETQVGIQTKAYGSKVLLHYGGGSIKKTGLFDQVVAALNEQGIDFIELGGVQPNPRLALVREGIELCKAHGVDFILAVGGGSVIDSAKAIAFGVKSEHDVWDHFIKPIEIKDTLPIGVVLTIPAAGSESSTGTVITNEEGWLKRSAGHPMIRPVFAIMNPELTYTLPDYQTACGICDMFSHVLERYFTNETNVDYTNRLCEVTMETIIKHGKVLKTDKENYGSRAEIMWAGTVAHNGLLGTGRIEDWASHIIEHELSATYDLAHGAGLAVIFPAWMKYIYKHDVNAFAQFASRVFGIKPNFEDLEETALLGIEKLISFYKHIGLPTTLKDAHILDDQLEEMAKKATINGPIGNFVKLTTEDVLNIYKLALE